jgi:replication-associated recombination protein RarA
MAYQALYRKYRPTNFDEVVGQTHIIQTLKNAIIQCIAFAEEDITQKIKDQIVKG